MNEELNAGLTWGGGVVAVALGATFARRLGDIDGDTVTRLVIGMNGLMTAYYGNLLPKFVVPSAWARQASWARQARWVAGCSMMLSGLVFAGLFAFAPIPVAATVGSGAVVAGLVVTLGYSLFLQAKAKAV